MRSSLLALLLVAPALSDEAPARRNVLVELYTSQG